MISKVAVVVLFAILTPSGDAVTDNVWTGFVTKWAFSTDNAFYTLPQTRADAHSNRWTEIEGVTAKSGAVGLCLQGDPRFIIFFDKKTGNAIGFQVGILVEDVKGKVPMNYENYPGITLKKLGVYNCYTAAIWFQINGNGRRQMWYEEKGKLIEVPTKASDLVAQTPWLKKSCSPTMGTHYYRLNSTTNCLTDFHPWSFLAIGDNLVGALCQIIGSPSNAPTRTWSEDFPSTVIRQVIPDAPPCLVNNVANYGLLSLHTWFHENPRSITC